MKESLENSLSYFKKAIPSSFFVTLDKKGVKISILLPSKRLGISMLFTIKRSRVGKPLNKEIDSFIATRRGVFGTFSTAKDHRKFIENFVDSTGIQTVEDIDENTINAYIEGVKSIEDSEHRRVMASVAIRQFIAYMDRKEIKKQIGRVGRPPKEDRNLEMLALRTFDAKRWSIQTLATKYGITKRAVWEILDRYKERVEAGK